MLAVNINTGVGSLKEKELKTGKTKNHREKKPQKDMKVENRKWRLFWDALDGRNVYSFEKYLKSKMLLESLD